MHSKVHYDSRNILGLVSVCIDKFIDMLINQSTIRRTPKRDDCVTMLYPIIIIGTAKSAGGVKARSHCLFYPIKGQIFKNPKTI